MPLKGEKRGPYFRNPGDCASELGRVYRAWKRSEINERDARAACYQLGTISTMLKDSMVEDIKLMLAEIKADMPDNRSLPPMITYLSHEDIEH